MYDKSSFMVSFMEPDNTVAISIKFRNLCSCTENSQSWSADVLQVGIPLEIKILSQLAQVTFHAPQPRGFNNSITTMEVLGIIITTPGGHNAD
jgi:serine/threonine-protein kinase RIO1